MINNVEGLDSKKPNSKFKVMRRILKYAFENKDWLKANKLKNEISQLLTRVNMELGKLGYADEIYTRRVAEYNQAVIESEKAKYYWEQAMTGGSRKDWTLCFRLFRRAISLGTQMFEALKQGSRARIPFETTEMPSLGTETLFSEGVPLVPEILPLVILKGTDFEMGYQYAQQVIQIYGKWIMERKAGICFSEDELKVLSRWEEQVRRYAPEILEMCRGWAAGATDAGVPMNYEDVLDLWTGHTPPAELPHNLTEIGLPVENAHPFCSGVAAWGRATKDGKLVTASTGDHNPAHAAVVVAFPKTGNNFIATPFHVTGDIRSAPRMFMMGHPGMNSKGVAYVEHGGEPRLAEPMDQWGYGIRKGTVIFHLLRFANSAREALQMELSFPVGDVGTVMGSAGGFWADSTYAYVSECRKDPVAIREAGMLAETDFLYACNGILHPELKDVWWMKLDPDNWSWDEHGGWHPKKYMNFDRGMMGDIRKIMSLSESMIQNGNRDRCLYYYRMMNRAVGSIDLDYMKMVLRNGGTPPEGDWNTATAEFERTGNWGDVSAAHSTNTITVAMKPDNGGQGIYTLCHGEAKRGLAPFAPKQGVYMYNETNAFWEIKLASGPEGMAAYSREKAVEYIDEAKALSEDLTGLPSASAQALEKLMEAALSELDAGDRIEAETRKTTGNPAVYGWSKALRHYTRSQVRALQVIQAFKQPPCRPEEI